MDGAGPGDTQTIGHWSNISGQICIFISVLRLFYFYLHYRKIEDISLFVWKMRVDIAGNILFLHPICYQLSREGAIHFGCKYVQ